MTAQNVGAGKWDRVTRIAQVGVLYSVLLTGSIVLLIELLDTAVFGLFLPAGSAALGIASHLNRIVTARSSSSEFPWRCLAWCAQPAR